MRRFGYTALIALLSISSAFPGTYEEELKSLSSAIGTALEKAGLKTIAVASLRDLDGKETKLGKLLAEEISVELVNQNRGFSVVERANLNRLLDEHKLTEEGLVDPENAKKLKLAGIDALIFGTIVPFEKTYRVQLKAVATDSAKVIGATRGSIAETDSLNAMMGVARPSSGLQASVDQPAPSSPDRTQLRKPFDFGRISIEINSVVFNRKTGRVRVTFSVTEKAGGDSFAYHLVGKGGGRDPRFVRFRKERNPVLNLAGFELKGEASDDKGNSYRIVMPADAGTVSRLAKGQPVAFQLDYQAVPNAGGQVQVPDTLTFWFNFHAGHPSYFDNAESVFKLSLADYHIDKVQ